MNNHAKSAAIVTLNDNDISARDISARAADIGGRKQEAASRRNFRRVGVYLVILAGATAFAHYGHSYLTTGRYLESTDDAYVKADSTLIAPKVSGYIAQVLVTDNQKVKAGQVLARIDDRDFRAARDQAHFDVAAANAAMDNLRAQIELQTSTIAQSQADVAAAKASLKFAKADQARYQDLMKTGYGTVQKAQAADAALEEKTAQLVHDRAAQAEANQKVQVLATALAQAQAQAQRAQAFERQAELNLSYTTITAPVDGTVGARSLRVGQYVQAGTQLMAVVPMNNAYVVANFKETQLTHVHPGQKVDIKVDSFPDTVLHGHVDSLSPASGLEFSLLPPDNATGNFTKIVQRIPVKITLDPGELAGRLRSGMSAEPVINTKPE